MIHLCGDMVLVAFASDILTMRVLALYSKGGQRILLTFKGIELTKVPVLCEGKRMSVYLKSLLALAAASRLVILIYITWVQDSESYDAIRHLH